MQNTERILTELPNANHKKIDKSTTRGIPPTIKDIVLSVKTQLFVYCTKQLQVSVIEYSHQQAVHKNKTEIFTILFM
jgi:hypothetical protein